MQITNSTAVVTGATTGIGRAIALALGERGASVAVCARNQQAVEQMVGELESRGVTATGLACDVSDEQAIARFAEHVHQQFGHVDALVNNAGIGHLGEFLDLTTDQIDETFAVNVRGLMLVTAAFLPRMLEREIGHIVNVASLAGRNGFVGGTVYGASKHAVMGFSKSLMLEVRDKNIRVVAICPGTVETPFFEKAGIDLQNTDKVLQPEDVAATVVAALELPQRALVSELDIRPTNP